MPPNLVRLALVVAARPVSIASAVRLDLAAHPMGSLPGAVYTHSAVAAQPRISPLLFACDGAWTWRGCHIQAEFCSRPLAQPRSPLPSCSSDVAPPDLYMTCSAPGPGPVPSTSLCDVRGQRGRRAAPPDIRQRTDGAARTQGSLVPRPPNECSRGGLGTRLHARYGTLVPYLL